MALSKYQKDATENIRAQIPNAHGTLKLIKVLTKAEYASLRSIPHKKRGRSKGDNIVTPEQHLKRSTCIFSVYDEKLAETLDSKKNIFYNPQEERCTCLKYMTKVPILFCAE